METYKILNKAAIRDDLKDKPKGQRLYDALEGKWELLTDDQVNELRCYLSERFKNILSDLDSVIYIRSMKNTMTALALLLFSCTSFAQVTTYSITVTATKSFSLVTNGGQRYTRPLNSIFLSYSKDSAKVQVLNVYDKKTGLMAVPDSVIHFYTTGLHFTSKNQLDSFFKISLLK